MGYMPTHLFNSGNFTLHSGQQSSFKIDCDALTTADLEALACFAVGFLPPFGSVEGVPTGGLSLAAALKPYATEGPLLIVDDVLTTGASMEEHRDSREAIGLVIFARGQVPAWVTPLFTFCQEIS